MPDIRSIVKNRSLNRDRGAEKQRGSRQLGRAMPRATHVWSPVGLWPGGASEKQDPLCGVRASLGTPLG